MALRAPAQSISPLGLETRAHVPLSGDQVFPDAAFDSDRGILVWEDNFIDAHRTRSEMGSGIAACLVDADLNPLSRVFRVHQYTLGDQKNPRVALLPDGGAIFTFEGNERWRGRRPGQADAFARFMSPNGRMSGRDLTLTPKITRARNVVTIERPSWRNNRLWNRRWRIPEKIYYGRSQTSGPIPVVLAHGQPAVIYSQVRRAETNTFTIETEISTRLVRGSIFFRTNDVLRKVTYTHQSGHDIYLQRFNGARRRTEGNEIQINQFLPNNQRHPSAVVLADGRILVAWVSEDSVAELPGQSSRVVIRARFLNEEGLPVGDDFVVNTDDRICARPTVSAASDGGFAIAWNQRDVERDNSWDIHARVYDAAGQPTGSAFRVNEHTFGDQFAPALGGAGRSHILSWVSLNQDGSMGGIMARQLSAEGPAGTEFLVNNTVQYQQIQPRVVSAGGEDACILWSGYMGADGFEILARDFRTTPALQAPPPPTVTSQGETSLLVQWRREPIVGLQHYELYMDDSATPVQTASTQYMAENLGPGSDHRYRLAYALNDGRRSLRSAEAVGTTDGVADGGSPGEEGGLGEGGPGGTEPGGTGAAALTATIGLVGEDVRVTWNATPGATYQMQISNDLVAWVDFRDPVVAEGDTASMVISPKEVTMVFRVVEVSQP